MKTPKQSLTLLRRWATTLLQQLITLLFPSRCCGCGRVNELLCAGCRAFIAEEQQQLPECISVPLGVSPSGEPESLTVWTLLHYDGALKALIVSLKHRDMPGFAKLLRPGVRALINHTVSELAGQGVDPRNIVLVPIPSRRSRVRQRGYHHLRLLLRVAGVRDQRVCEALAATGARTGQVGLGQQARQLNALRIRVGRRAREIRGRQIVLFDDICTSGATLRGAALCLSAAGYQVAAAAALYRVMLHTPK
ncbi:ComF family protein [Leucobacter sp. OH1287]|uniref:ComF family protein n=1 Tax=Leucobacter sp. OH1287 TaxID=2491049 RepID=UPI000F5FB93E|nr:ComF family protein [Leucobacter sp. OH1287]RRD61120.1 ComF family protein [Leucobacter sp. OH1287]